MVKIEVHQNRNTKFVANVFSGQTVRYTSRKHSSKHRALEDANLWIEWSNKVVVGDIESIYYILAVPETWAGPPNGAHPYSGLRMKIGRTKDVIRRWKTLRTGTSNQLIIHALEPGDSAAEQKLHQRFKVDRRQGEWFACSPDLTKHVFDTWAHYRILPPEHQALIVQLADRMKILQAMRNVFDGPPDMINPSLNESWHGNIFIDLYHKTW